MQQRMPASRQAESDVHPPSGGLISPPSGVELSPPSLGVVLPSGDCPALLPSITGFEPSDED
jgi:hypothetical protein